MIYLTNKEAKANYNVIKHERELRTRVIQLHFSWLYSNNRSAYKTQLFFLIYSQINMFFNRSEHTCNAVYIGCCYKFYWQWKTQSLVGFWTVRVLLKVAVNNFNWYHLIVMFKNKIKTILTTRPVSPRSPWAPRCPWAPCGMRGISYYTYRVVWNFCGI